MLLPQFIGALQARISLSDTRGRCNGYATKCIHWRDEFMQQEAASLDRQVMLDFVKTLGASFVVGLAWSIGMALLVLALAASGAG